MKVLWQGENYRLTARYYAGMYGFDKRRKTPTQWEPVFITDSTNMREALAELGQWFEQQGATK